jgi:two-component system, response regulator
MARISESDKHVPADILLVDDLRSDAEITTLALARVVPAAHVLWMDDGQEALEYLLNRPCEQRGAGLPRMLLTDLQMPRMSGIDLIAKVRGKIQMKRLPIVVVSGAADMSQVFECQRLGADGYVTKLADFEAFTALMGQVISRWISVEPRNHIAEARPRPDLRT